MSDRQFPIDRIVEMYCQIPPDDTDDPAGPTRPSILHVHMKSWSEPDILAYLPETLPAPTAAAAVLSGAIGLDGVQEFLVISEMLLASQELTPGDDPQAAADALVASYSPREMARTGDPRAVNGVVALSVRVGSEPECRIATEHVADDGTLTWEPLDGGLDMLGGPMKLLSELLG